VNEQETTSDEEAADFGNAPSAGAVEMGGKTSEKHEGRRAKMCDPACEKERRIGYIARIPATDGEKISGMVQSHKGHDQAAQEINAVESWSSSRDGRTLRGRGPAVSCNRWIVCAKFRPSKHFDD
jgi:hypothetical protein